MRLVFLGAPGVGKGTQAALLAEKFGWSKISTGDILREAIRNRTPLGMQAKACVDRGQLVPDEVVIGLVKDKLCRLASANGFVLDGFPRTVRQAEELAGVLQQKALPLDQVINVTLPHEDILRRLTGRRSCCRCHAVYHVDFHPPQHEGICDRCGGELVQRTDDKRETVQERLAVYEAQTAPVIAYYQARGILSDVNGLGTVDEVHQRVVQVLSAHGLS